MMSSSPQAVSQSLEQRTVVSCLIFPHQPYASKPFRLLLFRRSDKVRTYQRKLSPIAGSVEADDNSPLTAAWREVKEETGFGTQHLELWRRGVGFEFTDEKAVSGQKGEPSRGRIWKVWPFAFCLKKTVLDQDGDIAKLGLNLDWEHTACEWINVDQILQGDILHDCVPKLEVTLEQLFVDPSSLLHCGLNELRLDHEHGARELATMAIRSLIRIVEHDQKTEPPKSITTWWKSFCRQAFHLAINGRPSMGAAICSAVALALDSAKVHIETPASDTLDKVKRSLEASIKRRGQIMELVSDRFSDFLWHRFKGALRGKPEARFLNILTLSSSSTIKSAILNALVRDPRLSIELRILESRPLNEGASLAKALTDEAEKRREFEESSSHFHDRLRIVLASDASVGILSKDLDLVLIGADRVSEAGDVSNKTGSLAAILVSKAVTKGSVKVVCVSESEKIAASEDAHEHLEEENAEEELTSSWHVQRSSAWNEMVTIRNVYFEWCPAELIDYYICEHGTLSTNDINQMSKQISKLIEETFPFEKM